MRTRLSRSYKPVAPHVEREFEFTLESGVVVVQTAYTRNAAMRILGINRTPPKGKRPVGGRWLDSRFAQERRAEK